MLTAGLVSMSSTSSEFLDMDIISAAQRAVQDHRVMTVSVLNYAVALGHRSRDKTDRRAQDVLICKPPRELYGKIFYLA
jgi:hypothetical protein